MSLHFLLNSKMKLGAGMILSSYLPLASKFIARAERGEVSRQNIPVFMAHGTMDNVVPFVRGKESMELLRKHVFGDNLIFKTYPMAHSSCDQEISEFVQFLKKVVG